ncbi:hypothetical protein DCC62_21415 [candidate division KSB1 bacterium]|nr:MAG: hypothetical protein DCC62_21415 [candidate division KSB1 bacterium]
MTIGDKVFPPKCAEVTEHRRKNFGRMIYRQNYFESSCRQIILHNFQNFVLPLSALWLYSFESCTKF